MRIGATILLALVFAFSVHGEVRKYSNEFLAIGVGARALGMSGSQVASVHDVTATYWNPAGIQGIEEDFQVSLMHAEYFAGIANYDYGAIALPLKDEKRAIGLSIIRFGVDNIPNTLHLIDANGRIVYDNVTEFSVADYGFLFNYAQEVFHDYKQKLKVGGNFKIVHRVAGDFATAWGFGLDVGVQWQYENLWVGGTIRDLTTTFNSWSFNFTEEEQEILLSTGNSVPTGSLEQTAPRIIGGAAYMIEINEDFTILPELNVDINTDGRRNVLFNTSPFSIDLRGGFEAGYKDFVFIRGGVGNIQRATREDDLSRLTTMQPNVGLGLKFGTVSLDYAFTDVFNQSQALYSHIFSVNLNFAKK